jgi:hypothetical protein
MDMNEIYFLYNGQYCAFSAILSMCGMKTLEYLKNYFIKLIVQGQVLSIIKIS